MQARIGSADDALVSFHANVMPLLDAAFNFAQCLTRDTDAAEEIVQEAFLRAHGSFDGYRGGDARAWLFKIVRNCYHRWLMARRARLHSYIEPRHEDHADTSAAFAVSDQDTSAATLFGETNPETIRSTIRTMPRPLREIMVLRELEGLSYGQIAEVTSLSIGTVMSRLARARSKLRSAWRGHAQPAHADAAAATLLRSILRECFQR